MQCRIITEKVINECDDHDHFDRLTDAHRQSFRVIDQLGKLC